MVTMQLIAYTSLKKACGSNWPDVSKLLTRNDQNTNRHRVAYAMISQGDLEIIHQLVELTSIHKEVPFELARRVQTWCYYQSWCNDRNWFEREFKEDLEVLTDLMYHLYLDISMSTWDTVRIGDERNPLFDINYDVDDQSILFLGPSLWWTELDMSQRHACFRNVANTFKWNLGEA